MPREAPAGSRSVFRENTPMLTPPVREALDAVMASVDALAAVVARQGAEGRAALDGLHAGGHRDWSDTRPVAHEQGSAAAAYRDAVAGLQALEMVATASHAKQVALLVAAAGQAPEALTAKLPDDEARDTRISDIRAVELAAAMNCTPNRARTLACEARVLNGGIPRVLAAVQDGRVTAYQSRLAVEAWRDLTSRFEAAGSEVTDRVAERFQTRILARAHLQTAADFRRTTRAAVAMLAPASHEAALAAARSERNVSIQPAADGMAYLTAYLDMAQATRVMQTLTHCARTDRSLTGTQAQRTADALVAIVTGASDVNAASRSQAAEIQVLVSFDAMQRHAADLAAGRAPEANLVGQVAGSGMTIEGRALLDLMADAKFRRLVIDPASGQLLDYGRDTYRPPAALRDHVQGRDRTCRAPGCIRPARYSDIDHVVPWESGGTTADTNLASLCRTHHVLKTHGEWRYTLDPGGGATWLTPHGLAITKPPGGYAELIPDDDEPPF